MSQWDIRPDLIDAVLSTTTDHGNELVGAIGGANALVAPGDKQMSSGGNAPAPESDLGELGLLAANNAQSPLIASALLGFFENRMPGVIAALTRLQGMIIGTGGAKNAILDGDQQMATTISATMTQAVATGDFSALMPHGGG